MVDDIVNLKEWLSQEYNSSLDKRVSRLEFLVKTYGDPDGYQLFYGGTLVKDTFEEIRWSFINGQFIACILLCQCFIENSLRGILSMGGLNYGATDEWLEKSGFYDLIEKAFAYQLINELEADDFDWLRETRAQYIHHKPAFSKKVFDKRYVEAECHPSEIYEEDAKKALKILFKLIQRKPFRY